MKELGGSLKISSFSLRPGIHGINSPCRLPKIWEGDEECVAIDLAFPHIIGYTFLFYLLIC